MATLQVMAALACAAHFPNPHPHAISNAQDAIATAYAEWNASYPGGGLAIWKTIYSARQTGSIWVLTPDVPGSGYKGEGTHITLDAKTGCIVSEVSSD